MTEAAQKERWYKRIKWDKVLEYSLPALLTIFIVTLAMIFKAIFPFGKNSIGLIDFNDGLVPAYTALWDVLHGDMGIFATWKLGAGGSFISSAVLNSFLSPLCWLVALFPRTSYQD